MKTVRSRTFFRVRNNSTTTTDALFFSNLRNLSEPLVLFRSGPVQRTELVTVCAVVPKRLSRLGASSHLRIDPKNNIMTMGKYFKIDNDCVKSPIHLCKRLKSNNPIRLCDTQDTTGTVRACAGGAIDLRGLEQDGGKAPGNPPKILSVNGREHRQKAHQAIAKGEIHRMVSISQSTKLLVSAREIWQSSSGALSRDFQDK